MPADDPSLYEAAHIIPPDVDVIREMNPSQKDLKREPEYWPQWAQQDLQRLAAYRIRCTMIVKQAQREG